MSRTAARVTQADVARALRAAQQAGPAWRVEIATDGVIRIVQGDRPGSAAAAASDAPLAPAKEWRL